MDTQTEVVNDIIANLDEKQKDAIRNTPKAELFQFHHTWGRQIRNTYQLWNNKALLADIGETHPDDASSVVIKSVWEKIR